VETFSLVKLLRPPVTCTLPNGYVRCARS